MRTLKLDKKIINEDSNCYVIAEIGHNHQGSVEKCKEIFLHAKTAKADAVKLQKRSNKDLYTKFFFNSIYDNKNSYGKTYGLHREALEFKKEDYIELQEYAKSIDLTFFATPFDLPSVDFLENLNMPFYKIASADITIITLIEYVARLKKPMIVSTGGATLKDIERAVNSISSINKEFAILQCSSSYPTHPSNVNLNFIKKLLEKYPDNIIGYSSHDNGIVIPITSYVLGGRIIEKHFTLDRTLKGTDHPMSLEPTGLQNLVKGLHKVKLSLGDGKKVRYPEEEAPLLKMQKKIVALNKISKGQKIKIEDLAIKSPGDGIPPYEINEIVGMEASKNFEQDEALDLDFLNK